MDYQLPVRQNQASCQVYFNRLRAQQLTRSLFPLSDGPVNPDMTKENWRRYDSQLSDYIHQSEPNSDKFLLWPAPNGRVEGHKFHLNVSAVNVREVSTYLREQGYFHKYMSGGEPCDGQIFTVYIGEKDLADHLAQRLSSDLKGLLARPNSPGDVEYAPNVAGRFRAGHDHFHRYGLGIRGMSAHNSVVDDLRDIRDTATDSWFDRVLFRIFERPRFLRAFEISYHHAATEFGTYFYGSGLAIPSDAHLIAGGALIES